jgi:hypothetical protein
MSVFLGLVEFLVAIGVVVAAISNYLIINKLWKRKHLRNVAESISISAAFLGLATALPMFIQLAAIDRTPLPAIKTAIGLVTGVVFVLIGTGLWVQENRGLSFRRLLLRALNLERRESTHLIKSMLHPKGAEQILQILGHMAAIDRHVHEKEIALIHGFAHRWRIPSPDLTPGAVEGDGDMLEVRQAVLDYLSLGPPFEQAAQLQDVLSLFVKADEEVTREEEIVLEEVNGLITQYVTADTLERSRYEVLIVPQSDEQFGAVQTLIPGARARKKRGGTVFSAGSFFSVDYAEVICQKYIALGLFTAHVAH